MGAVGRPPSGPRRSDRPRDGQPLSRLPQQQVVATGSQSDSRYAHSDQAVSEAK